MAVSSWLLAYAPVAELVDALDLGSSVSRRAGSSPVRRTNKKNDLLKGRFFCFLFPLAYLAFFWA